MGLPTTLTSIFVLAIACWAMFQMKYKVLLLEEEAKNIDTMILETEESLHMLRAEWAHLTDPESLKKLCKKYLDLQPPTSAQMIPMQKLMQGQNYDKKALEDLLKSHVASEDDKKGGDRA